MTELSDVQNEENAQVSDTVVGEQIPVPEKADAIETPDKVEKAEKPKKLSLREQLNESIKSVRKEEAERNRDVKTGKFVGKDQQAAPEAAAPEKEIPAPEKDAQPKEPSKAVGPPPGWSQESKAFFNSLPADHPLRKDVAKREEEVSNGFKKYADTDKRYQEIEQVLAPVRHAYQAAGVQSDAEAIKRLFMWEGYIRSNPAKAIHELAGQYGVNLSPAQSPDPSAGQDNPELRLMAQKTQSLESQLQQLQHSQVSKDLAAFAKDKPHFEKVRMSMGRLMQSGMATDLDAAYQQAIWADVDIRKQMLDEADAKRQAELDKAAKDKALKARAAAVSPTGRAPTPPAVVNGEKGSKGVRGAILRSIADLSEERA